MARAIQRLISIVTTGVSKGSGVTDPEKCIGYVGNVSRDQLPRVVKYVGKKRENKWVNPP